MVILGIDYGDRRIGLAKSDPMGMLATGLDTYVLKKGPDALVKHIMDLTKSLKIERIVIGLPLNMDGSRGPRADKTMEFADEIRNSTGLETVLWDERLSSMEAKETLRAQGRRIGRDKGAVDRAAACHILQSYLDSL